MNAATRDFLLLTAAAAWSRCRAKAHDAVTCIRTGQCKLRTKTMAAFAAVGCMAVLCGVAGLFFVTRITATATHFVDVTTPILTESTALVENAQRTRTMFYLAIEKGEDPYAFAQRFADLHNEIHQHIDNLRGLSERAETNIRSDVLEQREEMFHATLAATLSASARERTAAGAVTGQLEAFERHYARLTPMLVALIDRAEGEMLKAEDEIKVGVQTRTASMDDLGDRVSDLLNGTYQVVRNAGKLFRSLKEIEDTVRALVRTPESELPTIGRSFRDDFQSANAQLSMLGGRLRNPEDRAALATLRHHFVELEDTVLGAGGLLQSQQARMAASEEVALGQRSFDQIERAYLSVIEGAEDAARRLNSQARARLEAQFAGAKTYTAFGVLFTLLASVVFSLFFAHRLSAPLMSLAAQVTAVRAGGDLRALPDTSAAARGDEIGSLSRDFNRMIAELAEAREQLIAKSEAELGRQYERLDLAINSMPQGLSMFDGNHQLIISNRRYAEIYGLPEPLTQTGTDLRAILDYSKRYSTGAAYAEERWHAVEIGKPWQFVHELRNGRTIAVSQLPLPGGGSITTHEDITERRRVEAKITYMAHHDMLTSLPNRVTFREDMQKALEDTRDRAVAVLCLDLDYFKNVNDTLGHPVGDALLKAVATRLRACLRPADKVARLGGDEFAVIQSGVGQPGGSTSLASRLIKELGEPFVVEGHQVVIGVSIGISLAPNDGRDPDRLMKNADMALYRAKEDGRGTFRYFEPNMDARMQARRTLELDMRKALALDQFELHYQPLINLESGEISACEALMRWRHPDRGMISPAEFIPLAEEIGFINQLGSWALKTACAEARHWPDHVKLSVNLSPVQFKGGTLVADVAAALRDSTLDPHRLELEITEAVLLNETDDTLATLAQLRKLGVHISMDDFGTGYSSLSYLRKFPFDKIKIDQSFVRDLAEKPDSIAIVRAVAGLANTLGIITTAEGVETEQQLAQLKAEGCTEAQGYYFSRPQPAADIQRFIRRFGHDHLAVA